MDGLSEIDIKVKKSLEGTIFESSELKPLSGGIVNWAYVAKLRKPLPDATSEVMVKHGELFMSTKPDFPLTVIRCQTEVECFRYLSNSSFTGNANPTLSYNFTVRTPKYHHYDAENTNQILEYLPNANTLRTYPLKYLTDTDSASTKQKSRGIGESIGSWLKNFTQWSASDSSLRSIAAKNLEGKNVRHMVNYLWLSERIEQYPHILGDAKDILVEVEKAAAEEMKDESRHQVVHGDFGTGNILLPDAPMQERTNIPIFVVDWEMSHMGVQNVDFGQMIAEMYAVWLYISLPCGLWMMEGFIEAYGEVSDDFAFRTAIQTGTLLLSVTTIQEWWPAERIEHVVAVGMDIIVHAWKKDRSWFEKSDLACLFRRT